LAFREGSFGRKILLRILASTPAASAIAFRPIRHRRAGADRCLTCLDGEARDPQEDVALLAHGTGWMSPYQRDRYFEYGVLDRA
jgi:hypothetical protein